MKLKEIISIILEKLLKSIIQHNAYQKPPSQSPAQDKMLFFKKTLITLTIKIL